MADTSIVYDIIARDKASKTLSSVSAKAAILGAAVGAMAVKFGKDAISNASDLNETLNKSEVIFGKNAAAVEKWADSAAQNLGLSKAAALESAAGFGNMFDQLGFAGNQATKMSKQVVQLSADLGSFNNLPTAEVADMMSAAFRGEYDSLQRLIPNINAARVETEALAMTGKRNASELTAQEKAAATLAIVTRDGAAAAGDFEKTSGGLANQQKILRATYEDITAEVGTALLPVLTELAGELLDIIGFVRENSAVIVPLVGALGGLATVVWSVNKASQAWSATQTAFNAVLGRTAAATTDVGTKATGAAGILGRGGVWGLAIAAGVGVLATFAIRHAEAKQRIDEMTTSLDQSTGAITRETRATVVNNLEKAGALEAARKLGINLRDVTSAALGNESAQRRVNEVLNSYTKQLPEVSALTGAHTGANARLSAEQREVAAATSRVSSAINSTSSEMEQARDKAGRLREAMSALPRDTRVGVALIGGQEAINRIADLRYQLDNVPREVTVNVINKLQRIPAYAGGTANHPGGLALVGERGPELVSLPAGAAVSSASQTRQMMGSPSMVSGAGTSPVVNITINALDPVAAGTYVKRALDEHVRRNGPLRGLT